MSPTQISNADDQPLLNGANYIIWKTRVIATLDGKHLLGFVLKTNYDGLSDTEDDDVVMELPDEDDEDLDPNRADLDSPASPTDSLEDLAEPPAILSFTEQKKEDTRRTNSQRRPKPNKSELRRREARAMIYLLSTLDNIHVLLVRDKRTAYEIFSTIRERYEDKSLHGDPYYIQSYLMELKYEAGSDLTLFFLKMEQALHACSIATNSSLSDEQQSIYLYHAMPTSWRNDLQIWKGTRKFIPYAELRQNIEQKVRDELTKTKYIVHKGSPESADTSAETALKVIDSEPPNPSVALVSTSKHCDYCTRENHSLRECRVLQRDLLAGRAKGGTVLPENFAVHPPPPNRGSSHSFPNGPRPNGRYNGNANGNTHGNNQRGYHRGHNNNNNQHGRKRQFDGNMELFDRFGNSVHVDRNDFQTRKSTKPSDYGIIAITGDLVEHVSLAAIVATPDLTWTVDSGCTRHITAVKDWFTSLTPSSGAITVGGKTEIPVEGSGTIRLTLADAKTVRSIPNGRLIPLLSGKIK